MDSRPTGRSESVHHFISFVHDYHTNVLLIQPFCHLLFVLIFRSTVNVFFCEKLFFYVYMDVHNSFYSDITMVTKNKKKNLPFYDC